MPRTKNQNKVIAEWKAIDKIVGINPKDLREDIRKKYFATKSLLIKESENFRRSLNIPDYKSEMLTENTKLNTKDLVEFAENKLVELCNKNKKVAKKISEISLSKDNTEKIEYKLEALMLGDVYDYLVENKIQELDDLGLTISKELIGGYIKIITELAKS